MGDYTPSGTSNLVQITNNNFGTVTKASGNLPGFTFTPPYTGNYWICANVYLTSNTNNNAELFKITDGTNFIASGGFYGIVNTVLNQTICGVENIASLSPITIKLQGLTSNGRVVFLTNINPSIFPHTIEFSIFKMQ
jgi:hypothetical protein